MEWLNDNSPAIQAIVTVVLALATIVYVILTGRILRQSRESSEAAKRSAAAAERTTAFMKQQHEEQLHQGPQVVREEIVRAKGLIVHWQTEAHGQSPQMPDPEALSKSTLREAIPPFRLISMQCSQPSRNLLYD